MSEEFKAITTQEELDAAIGERIKRERKATEEKYERLDVSGRRGQEVRRFPSHRKR